MGMENYQRCTNGRQRERGRGRERGGKGGSGEGTYLSNGIVWGERSLQSFSTTDTNTNMSSLHQKSINQSINRYHRNHSASIISVPHLNHANIVGSVANSQSDGVLDSGLHQSNHVSLLWRGHPGWIVNMIQYNLSLSKVEPGYIQRSPKGSMIRGCNSCSLN